MFERHPSLLSSRVAATRRIEGAISNFDAPFDTHQVLPAATQGEMLGSIVHA